MNAEMEKLLREAERKGQWLFCHYQELWFSPEELREAQAHGKFRWGAVNWHLRNPAEKLEGLDRQIAALGLEKERFAARLRR